MRISKYITIGLGVLAMAASLNAKPYAVFHTSAGDFTCELFPDKAPKTVKNFVDLAQGNKPWQNPETNEVTTKPLYSGTIFHRTIPGFMIQGGDPMGNGRGGPGYRFEDEPNDLTFDQPGYLAMANAGPNTNGSQFFVTVVPTPHLNGKHTIFGKIVSGMDVVNKIVNMPGDPRSGQPVNPVKLESVEIRETAAGGSTSPAAKPTTGTK